MLEIIGLVVCFAFSIWLFIQGFVITFIGSQFTDEVIPLGIVMMVLGGALLYFTGCNTPFHIVRG